MANVRYPIAKIDPKIPQRPMAVVHRCASALRYLAFAVALIGLTTGTAPIAKAADGESSDWQVWGSTGYLGNAGHLKDSVREAEDRSTWSTTQEIFLTGDIRYGALGKFAFDLSQVVGNVETGVRDDFRSAATELYLDPPLFDSPNLSLRIGRQRLKWGVMEFFHPIDTLEKQPDPFRARQVIEGLDAAKVAYISSPSLSGAFLAIRDHDADATRFALRLDSLVDDFDVSAGLITYYQQETEAREDAPRMVGDRETD
ncbi:MAG TPA: hypothetical protein PLM32_12510 [Candidatus Competibacter sp.]|nr:hypothetical protein [Candidatus Competibacter sp.]